MGLRLLCSIPTTKTTSIVLPTLEYVFHVSRIHLRRSKLSPHITFETTPRAINGSETCGIPSAPFTLLPRATVSWLEAAVTVALLLLATALSADVGGWWSSADIGMSSPRCPKLRLAPAFEDGGSAVDAADGASRASSSRQTPTVRTSMCHERILRDQRRASVAGTSAIRALG